MHFINIDNKSLEHYGGYALQPSEISSLKKHEKFCLFFCVTKSYKASIFFAGLYTEFRGPLRRRFQANCLDIFNLLAETKKKNVQKPMIKLIYYYFLNTNSAVC